MANNTTFYREETFRVDHQVGAKLALMGSLIYDNGAQSQSPPLWAGGTYATAGSVMSVPSWAGVVHATYTISPTLLNEAAFNFNGNDLNIHDVGLLPEAVRIHRQELLQCKYRQQAARRLASDLLTTSVTPRGGGPGTTRGVATR